MPQEKQQPYKEEDGRKIIICKLRPETHNTPNTIVATKLFVSTKIE